MYLEGLAKFEKNRVLTEVPPEKDEKGEVTEVQKLEEGEIPDVYVGVFDPDEFLEKLEQFQPQYPRCQVPMKFGEVKQKNGNIWKYYRCPTKNWDTKCYVTCPVDEVGDYLRRVEKQTHPTPATTILTMPVSAVTVTSLWYWPPPTQSTTQSDFISSVPPALASSSNESVNPPGVWLKTFSLTETEFIKKKTFLLTTLLIYITSFLPVTSLLVILQVIQNTIYFLTDTFCVHKRIVPHNLMAYFSLSV